MKLRLRNNSIRLRLTRTEVDGLRKNGSIKETITFGIMPDQSITYVIEISTTNPAIHAVIDTNRITVVVPESIVVNWAATDQVGMEAIQKVGNGTALQICIEKDLKCGHDDDDADTFPHPHG